MVVVVVVATVTARVVVAAVVAVAVEMAAVFVLVVDGFHCRHNRAKTEDCTYNARCRHLDILCTSTVHSQDRMCRMWGP